jgi:hypothetical protein
VNYFNADPARLARAIDFLTKYKDDSESSVRCWPTDNDHKEFEDLKLRFPFGQDIRSLFSRSSQKAVYDYASKRLTSSNTDKYHRNPTAHFDNPIFAFCGMPGIGKTSFLNIMFMEALKAKKTVILHYGHNPDKYYIVTPDGKSWCVGKVRDLEILTRTDTDTNGYKYVYLYDPADIDVNSSANSPYLLSIVPGTICAYKFVATSPAHGTISYKHYQEVDNVFMSPWTYEHLRTLHPFFPALETPSE